MKFHKSLLLIAVLTLFGCQENPSLGADAAPSSVLPAALDGATSMQFARVADASNSERLEGAKAGMRAMFEISATAETWEAADAAAQRAIENAETELGRSTIEQATAKMMLTGYLTTASDDPEAARVALRYAERLVERGSPETEAVLTAVMMFRDEWTEAETRSVATGAIEALNTYVAEGGSCTDCERTEDAQRAMRRSGMEPGVFEARQLDAARRLREAAQLGAAD